MSKDPKISVNSHGLSISGSSLLLAPVSLIHPCIHMDTEMIMENDALPSSVL